MVSALARLDLDPWREAAELTRLPRETAAQRLGALLTTLPGGPAAHLESETTALRLVALLPHPDGSTIGPPPAASGLRTSARFEAMFLMIVFTAMSFIVMATLGFNSGRPLASADVASASRVVPPAVSLSTVRP